MSIIKLLEDFTTENLTKTKSNRRQMFGTMGSIGKKVAAAAVPFGLASNSMNASTSSLFQGRAHVGPLNLALTLEYLEAEFYNMALETDLLDLDTSGKVRQVYEKIAEHENAHVAFLIDNLGDDAVAKPTFDFTAGGAFDPFGANGTDDATAYAQLLALAQAFEDTGVRAYKGQAPALMGTPYLEPALQIHSVEARHASEIRRIRSLKGWITLDQRGDGMPMETQAVYDGEEVTTQATIDLAGYDYGDSPLVGDPAVAVSQAFDEPMSGETATAIASLFIVADSDSDS